MGIDNTVEITLDELKIIIHGLRMSTFSYVEDNASDEIKAMIKALPLPEDMGKMVGIPMAIKNLQKDIGNIMRLIELYGKRDIEMKTRYKSRTGLPPRYKVLDWRGNMKSEARTAIRNMVKVSSVIDEKGYGDLSGRINKFASDMIQDKFDEVEFEKIAESLKASGLEKEAGMWDTMKGFMGGAMGQVKNIGQSIWQAGQAGGLEAQFNSIFKQLEDFKKKVGALREKAVDPKVQAKMDELFKSIDLGEQQMNQAAQAVKSTEAQGAQAQPAAQGQPASQGAQAQAPVAAQAPQAAQAQPAAAQAPAADHQQVATSLESFVASQGQNIRPELARTIQTVIKALKAQGQPAPQVAQEQGKDLAQPAPAPVQQTASFNLKMHKLASKK